MKLYVEAYTETYRDRPYCWDNYDRATTPWETKTRTAYKIMNEKTGTPVMEGIESVEHANDLIEQFMMKPTVNDIIKRGQSLIEAFKREQAVELSEYKQKVSQWKKAQRTRLQKLKKGEMLERGEDNLMNYLMD